MKHLMQYGKQAVIMGTAGALSVVASDWLLDNYSEMVGYSRGATQVIGHVAVGAGVAAVGAPQIGAGIAIGGVVSGVEDIISFSQLEESERTALQNAQKAYIAARRAGRDVTRASFMAGGAAPPAPPAPPRATEYGSSGALGPGAANQYADRPRMGSLAAA